MQKKPFRPPLFIFDGVLIHNGKVKTKPFELISKIFSKTTSALTRGIFARISTEFNDYLQQYLYNFLERILIGESIGSGLLTANRHLYLMARRLLRKDQSKSNLFSLLTETHYVFYGDPFLRLSKT